MVESEDGDVVVERGEERSLFEGRVRGRLLNDCDPADPIDSRVGKREFLSTRHVLNSIITGKHSRDSVMGLLDLPEDILLNIASTLAIPDVLTLTQVSHIAAIISARFTGHADMSCLTRFRKRGLPLAQAR